MPALGGNGGTEGISTSFLKRQWLSGRVLVPEDIMDQLGTGMWKHQCSTTTQDLTIRAGPQTWNTTIITSRVCLRLFSVAIIYNRKEFISGLWVWRLVSQRECYRGPSVASIHLKKLSIPPNDQVTSYRSHLPRAPQWRSDFSMSFHGANHIYTYLPCICTDWKRPLSPSFAEQIITYLSLMEFRRSRETK